MKNKFVAAILGIFVGLLTVVLLYCLAGQIDKLRDKRVKTDIAQMLEDIYAPGSMAQFEQSKKKYSGKLVSEQVADMLYKKNSDDLTAEDLTRSVETKVYQSKANSNGTTNLYIADMWFYKGGILLQQMRFKFICNDKRVIESYTLERVGA